VRTARRYRTVHIRVGDHTISADDPLSGDLRERSSGSTAWKLRTILIRVGNASAPRTPVAAAVRKTCSVTPLAHIETTLTPLSPGSHRRAHPLDHAGPARPRTRSRPHSAALSRTPIRVPGYGSRRLPCSRVSIRSERRLGVRLSRALHSAGDPDHGRAGRRPGRMFMHR
jgi:hypothetical protein